MITQSELKELLSYNPETGVFTRVKNSGRAKVGDVAGCKDSSNGYIAICVQNKRYRAHRLAWLYVSGKFPKDQIDHINHDRADNRFANLREASNQENHKNTSIQKNNTSGVAGVNWHKASGKWKARIKVSQEDIHLGLFIDIIEAAKARKSAEVKYGFHENHGHC